MLSGNSREEHRRRSSRAEQKMELSLDLSLDISPKTISDVMEKVSDLEECSEKMLKIGIYSKGLEEEMRKIEVFKRELPLCVLLLRDAILTLKEEEEQLKEVDEEKELVTPKMKSVENEVVLRNDCSGEKKNDSNAGFKLTSEQVCRGSQMRRWNSRNGPGGFEKVNVEEDGESSDLPNLALMAQVSNPGSENSTLSRRKRIRDGSSSCSCPTQMPQPQGLRKQRRCWSPQLHRRFIDAIQRLGGSKVASPKQIRDVMKVEGLTNDEVKSHLQKYRLHIRKLERAGSPQAHTPMEGDSVHGEEEEQSITLIRP